MSYIDTSFYILGWFIGVRFFCEFKRRNGLPFRERIAIYNTIKSDCRTRLIDENKCWHILAPLLGTMYQIVWFKWIYSLFSWKTSWLMFDIRKWSFILNLVLIFFFFFWFQIMFEKKFVNIVLDSTIRNAVW